MEISKPVELIRGEPVVDGAGVKLNRIIGNRRVNDVDPFVLLDEFRSDDPDDYVAGFPTHPHRGIETITYMIQGVFDHKDSKGNGGSLTPGTVQWMTAGRGILHSEMPGQTDGPLWGYQLWLSLRAKDKMIPPQYQHLSAEMMPWVEWEGGRLKAISGRYGDVEGPARNRVPATYFDVRLNRGVMYEHTVNRNQVKFIYVHTGALSVGPEGDVVDMGEMSIMDERPGIVLEGLEEQNGFLFIAGVPNNERIVRGGPFVMNTEEEIAQAFEDYRSGRLQA
ncbi:MAG: pirin family protein [Theionarchaea archaeon]|nr:pirin family protein [Theionarchaea archaeon]